MIRITYTNRDSQTINVTADFFPVTVEAKNRKKQQKVQDTLTPMERAEGLALDLITVRRELNPYIDLSKIEIYYPNSVEPKIKTFNPLDPVEPKEEKLKEGKSFTATLKAWKKEWKHKKQKTTSLLKLLYAKD